jgi:monoamine oxidase
VETLRLAKELGLQVDDLLAYDRAQGGEDIYYFQGQRYSIEDAFNDFKTISRSSPARSRRRPSRHCGTATPPAARCWTR